MTSRDLIEVAETKPRSTDESVSSEIDQNRASAPEVYLPTNRLKKLGFVIVNLWLVFHLFAIVAGPASIEPASSLAVAGYDLVAPYLNLLYLDHGFRFFAPEPGPSTLVAYELTFPDGSKTSGEFPNRTIFPRLYYHRHFMLSEYLGNCPDDLKPYVERAFARNLCRETGAVEVSLTKILHETASVDEVRRGLTLNDPSFIKKTPLGVYTAEELQRPIDLFIGPKLPTNETQQSSKEEEKKGQK